MNFKFKNLQHGLTLIEIVVVIAIIGLIVSLGLITSFDSYRGYLFRSERTTLVSVLSRARSQAMNNMFETTHGICYDNSAKNYAIFRGSGYLATNPTNETVNSNSVAIIISIPSSFICSPGSGVIFSQLSGTTSPIDIVVTENNRVSTTSINYEGAINW